MVSYQQKITLKGSEASIDYFTDLLKAVKDENGSNTATVLYEAMIHWELAADSSVESTAGERSGLSRCFQLPLLCCGDRHSKVTLGLEKLKLEPILKSILARAKVGRAEYLLEALILVLENFQAGTRGSSREILVTDTGLTCAIESGRRNSRTDGEPAIIRRNSNKEPSRKENGNESSGNDWSTRRGQKPLSWRQRLAREQTAPPTSKTGWRARMDERDNGRVEDANNYGRSSNMLERENCRAEDSRNSGWRSRNEERENCRVEDSLNSSWRSRMEERENCRMKELQNSGWRSRMEERERDKKEESGRSACGNTVEARRGYRSEDKENRRKEEMYNNRTEDKENRRKEERYNKYHWSKHLIPLEKEKCKAVISSNKGEETFERCKQQMDRDYSYCGKTIERQNSLNDSDTSPSRTKRKLSTTKEEKKAQENIPKPKKRSTIRKDYDLHNTQVPEQSFEERKKMVHKLEDYMWVIPPDTRCVPGFQQSMTKAERHRQGIDCDEVFPGIVLGNGATVKKKDYLKKIGISHVLNAAESRGVNVNKEYFQKDSPNMEYMGLRVEDTPQTQICRYFLEVAEYMDEALLSDGRVFVNCVFGKSRSTTCVAVYLMIKHGWDALKALNHIRQARPVQVNSGFLQQLADLDYKLHWIRKGNAAKNDNENVEENDLKKINSPMSHEEHKSHKSHEIQKLEKVVFEIVEESICAPEKITTKKMISVKGNY